MHKKALYFLPLVIVLALFLALVGCFPKPTPDTTPPVVQTPTLGLSTNEITEGALVSVTATVTAEDAQSNLQDAVFTLRIEEVGGEYEATETITRNFGEVKSGSLSQVFNLSELPQVGSRINYPGGDGQYTLSVSVVVQNVKGLKADAKVSESKTLTVHRAQGRDPQISEPDFLPSSDGIASIPFRAVIEATDLDGDLSYLDFYMVTTDATVVPRQVVENPSGTNSLEISVEVTEEMLNIAPDDLEKELRFFILARDLEGNTARMDDGSLVAKPESALIVSQGHLGEKETTVSGLPQRHWGRYEGTTSDRDQILTDPDFERDPTYTLPFGITTLGFDFEVPGVREAQQVDLFIYSRPNDIFSESAQFLRGSASVASSEIGLGTSIEFANLSFDDAKWLAVKIDSIEKPWFVWKIAAADHSTEPDVTLEYQGTIEEFLEGKPINVKVRLKDEMLKSLNDLEIRFQQENGEFATLESLMQQLNQQVSDAQAADYVEGLSDQEEDWNPQHKFAIRYHVKATFEDFDEPNDAIRVRDLIPDPDPKIVYAISKPDTGANPGDPHLWYRFDGTLDRVQPTLGNADRLWDLVDPVEFIYFFGVPDRQVEEFNEPAYITELATMTLSIFPEIVVIDEEFPDEVIVVADGALGAGNRYVLETSSGYNQYDLSFSAENAKNDIGNSDTKIFPIYADNTSPTIQVTYGPDDKVKVFADRRQQRLSTGAFDLVAVPMFFADTIKVKAGQQIALEASDNVSLYDFIFIHTSTSTSHAWDDWRENLPAILNTDTFLELPMNFDFWYKDGYSPLDSDVLYEGIVPPGDIHDETKPSKTMNQIFVDEPNTILSKILYTDPYREPGTGSSWGILLDPYYEFYENYTWSQIWNADTSSISAELEEQYFGMRTTSVSKEIIMPSLPGTYWVWAVARDRGAQDSLLFDYENDRVNIDPLTGQPEIYSQDVFYNQNRRFTKPTDINLEAPNIFYENSESESDAPMVVLLRVIVETHSMDIQRLDIHEPDLVSYPATYTNDDSVECETWYAHSYNVLQLDKETKVAEFDPNESRDLLPIDMYPVFKRTTDRDAGNRFGLNALGDVFASNLWEAIETDFYGDVPEKDASPVSNEAVPVVGGQGPTKFRVKTHEDIEKVTLELVEGEIWTVEDYAFQKPDVFKSITISKNEGSTKWDGEGVGGYWVWQLDWKSDPDLSELAQTESTHTLVVKAYNNKEGTFWEQWQWPIFVDTRGPEISLFSIDDESPLRTEAHLNLLEEVEEGRAQLTPDTVRKWGAFLVEDRGGIMMEYIKGLSSIASNLVPDDPIDNNTGVRQRHDRAYDMVNHQAMLWWPSATYINFGHDPVPIDISNATNSYVLGFPSESPDETDVASIRYLDRLPVLPEDLASTKPWHDYFTSNTPPQDWGCYDGDTPNLRNDPREIPELVLFNNVDFGEIIWENTMPNSAKHIHFEMVDELGNPGEWESWLKLMAYKPFLVEATAVWNEEDPTKAYATVTFRATSTQKLEKVQISIDPCGRVFTFELDPISLTFEEDLPLGPAFEGTRTVVATFTANLDALASAPRDLQPAAGPVQWEADIWANYPGEEPIIDIDFSGVGLMMVPEQVPSGLRLSMFLDGIDFSIASPAHIIASASATDDNCDKFLLDFSFADPSTESTVGSLATPVLLPAATDLATSDATKLFELTAYASALDFILGPSKQASETIWVSFADPQQFITDFSTDSTLTVATVTVVLFESVVATSLDAEITVNGLAYSPDSIFLPDAGVELDGSWVRCFDTIDLVFNQPIGQTVSKVTLSDFWTIHGVFIPSASLTK